MDLVDAIISGFASSSAATTEVAIAVIPVILFIFGALTGLAIGFRLWRKGAGKRA